ncbi:MAG: N-acetylmuramoyl-L-alanine amidase [Candidatus Sumerlaeaceae bacterium]
MQSWRYLMAGSICASLAFIPQGYEADRASMPELNPAPHLANLKLQQVTEATPFTSRSPISAFASSNRPLDGVKICVDPGHGGQYLTKTHYTGGTIGVATGQTESDVNLRVSLILREYLKAAGAQVFMTREREERCQGDTCKRAELDFRSDMANMNNCDLFISVHHNEAAGKPGTNYTACFYPKGVNAAVSLAENISNAVSKYIGTQNIGGKIGDYRVLNRIKMPGVIVEASFLSSPTEDQRLAQLSYNKMEAKAIATGILNYVRLSRGRQVDFNTIFAPIDDQAGSAQMMADASFIRRQIVERHSLFGVRYEEVTYDAQGSEVSRREVGNSSLQAKKTNGSAIAKAKSRIKGTASKLASAAKTTAKTASKDAKKVVSKVSAVSKKKTTTAQISKPVVSVKAPARKTTSVADAKTVSKTVPKFKKVAN